VQVPAPAFAKSSPVAPCVKTAVEPSVPAALKVTVTGITGLWVPISSAAVTVKTIEVEAVREPLVPAIVNVAEPRLAALLAVSVNTLVPAVGFGLKDAVTPLGNPETARVTFPANPDTSLTAMVNALEVPP
jgi:hypothetical protein